MSTWTINVIDTGNNYNYLICLPYNIIQEQEKVTVSIVLKLIP